MASKGNTWQKKLMAKAKRFNARKRGEVQCLFGANGKAVSQAVGPMVVSKPTLRKFTAPRKEGFRFDHKPRWV